MLHLWLVDAQKVDVFVICIYIYVCHVYVYMKHVYVNMNVYIYNYIMYMYVRLPEGMDVDKTKLVIVDNMELC